MKGQYNLRIRILHLPGSDKGRGKYKETKAMGTATFG